MSRSTGVAQYIYDKVKEAQVFFERYGTVLGLNRNQYLVMTCNYMICKLHADWEYGISEIFLF